MQADYEQIDKLLTKEQILGMEPGQELDGLITTKIMGWVNTGRCFLKDGFRDFQPSTDISAAWEVITKTNLLDKLWLTRGTTNNRWYVITITIDAWGDISEVGEDLIPGGCDTAPEAICKAALLAVLEVDDNASQARLKEIQERVDKATPGPWRREVYEEGDCDAGDDGRTISWSNGIFSKSNTIVCKPDFAALSDNWENDEDAPFIAEADNDADAELIANAPTDIQYLLASLEEAQAENTRLESRSKNQQKEYQRVYNNMAQYGQEADELEIKLQQLRETIINVKGLPCLEEWDHIYKIAGGERNGTGST